MGAQVPADPALNPQRQPGPGQGDVLSCQMQPTVLAHPHPVMDVEGHPLPPAEGGAPDCTSATHQKPHLPAALPVHDGVPPHDPAVACRLLHRTVPPPHRGGDARHEAGRLPKPPLPRANRSTCPAANMEPPGDSSPTRPSRRTRQYDHAPHITRPTAREPECTQDTRESARTHPMPEPASSTSLPKGP